MTEPKLRSRRTVRAPWRWLGSLFFAAGFGAVGVAVMYEAWTAHARWMAARDGLERSCHITHSEAVAEEREDSDGDIDTCWRPHIEYVLGDAGDGGGLDTFSPYDESLGHICSERWARERVRRYPAGSDVACWVGGGGPVYLDRSFRVTSIAMALVGLPFLLLGLVGVLTPFFMLVSFEPAPKPPPRRQKMGPASWYVLLEPEHSRAAAWLWGGSAYVIGVMTLFVAYPFETGGGVCFVLAVAVIVLDLLLLVGFVLNRGDPRVWLFSEHDHLVRGRPSALRLRVRSRRPSTVVRVELVALEITRDRDGDSRRLILHDETLLQERPGSKRFERDIEIVVPSTAMHTFTSQAGDIVWTLRVSVEAATWATANRATGIEVRA